MSLKFQPLLQEVLSAAKDLSGSHDRLKAIFDLDSTLFDVSPRTTQILHEFANDQTNSSQFPNECSVLKKVKDSGHSYKVRHTLEAYGLTNPPQEFVKSLVEFWKQGFFSNKYLNLDRPYKGAIEYVNELSKAGAEIFYLTGRDKPRMGDGTIKALQTHGFPVSNGATNLILKPHSDIEDTHFKKDFFEQMEQKAGPVWFFENEPANIDFVCRFCPHIKIIFIETVHSGRMPPPGSHIPKISGFLI